MPSNTQADAAKNGQRFLIALASRSDPAIRALIVKQFFDAKTANDTHAALASILVTSDPHLLNGLKPGTLVRVRALLLLHAQTVGVAVPYFELRNPAHALAAIVAELGEAFATGQYKVFTDWIIDQAPLAPEFVSALTDAPILFDRLFSGYLGRASNSQWDVSNPFATGAPALDAPLSATPSAFGGTPTESGLRTPAVRRRPLGSLNGRLTVEIWLKAPDISFSAVMLSDQTLMNASTSPRIPYSS